MKIAFYSSDASNMPVIFGFPPGRTECWKKALDNYPDTQLGFFFSERSTHLIETEPADDLENISFFPIKGKDASFEDYAETIAAWKPDLAVAFGRPEIPLDWNPVRDSLIGEELEKRGIHTLCHSCDVTFDSFEKDRINARLTSLGFHVPKGVHVQSFFFHAEEKYGTITANVYQEYVRNAILKLGFPLIVKPSAGSGSVGIHVANTLEEVMAILNREKDGDLLVEEMIEGENFGVSLLRSDKGCVVYPPVIFSTTEDKITDPFKSFKIGPILSDDFKVKELSSMLHEMAEKLDLKGPAEVDLIYGREKWYIIELNPRFSMLDQVAGSMVNKTIPLLNLEMLLEEKISDPEWSSLYPSIDFKISRLGEEKLKGVMARCPFLSSVMEFCLNGSEGDVIDYLEPVVQGKDKEDLKANLDILQKEIPEELSLERVRVMKESIDKYLEVCE